MNGPRILSPVSVDLPIPPASVETLAMAMAREQALGITDDRQAVLRACAFEVERWEGMVLWPGENGARACQPEMEIDHDGELVGWGVHYGSADGYGARLVLPVCPELQNLSTSAVSVTSVQVWDFEAEAYVDPPGGHKVLPGGRVMVQDSGTYRIVASLTAPDSAPGWAVEGLRRYFSYRERLRPAEKSGGGGELEAQGTQAGGLMRSGAAEVLRAGRMRVAV